MIWGSSIDDGMQNIRPLPAQNHRNLQDFVCGQQILGLRSPSRGDIISGRTLDYEIRIIIMLIKLKPIFMYKNALSENFKEFLKILMEISNFIMHR